MGRKNKILAPTFSYVASPYTHENRAILEARHAVTMAYTAYMLHNKKLVFSPIVHCHPTADFAKISNKFGFWKKYNFTMLKQASKLIVLELPGWKDSKGVGEEIAYAEGLGIKIERHSWEEIYDVIMRYPTMKYPVRELVTEVRTRVVDIHHKQLERQVAESMLGDDTENLKSAG